jgi:AraC family transcriptional regulator
MMVSYMKKTTQDEYIHSIYKVLFYVEQNYNHNLTLDELSRVANFSKYHFHRIFKSIIGENLNEYIKRVRLSRSANRLYTTSKITNVALMSGYETSSSFTKAFKEYFGLTPTEFRDKIKSKQGEIMLKNIEIVQVEPIEVLYVRREGDYKVSASEAFEVLMSFAYQQKIKYKKNLLGKEAGLFGIGHDDPNIVEADKLRYDACITYDDRSVKPIGEIGAKTIEGGKYVSYLHKGSYEELKEVYQELMKYIIENNLKLADRAPFEKYLNRDPRRTKPENLKTEIFIPIV